MKRSSNNLKILKPQLLSRTLKLKCKVRLFLTVTLKSETWISKLVI